jgi:hypothetical protein
MYVEREIENRDRDFTFVGVDGTNNLTSLRREARWRQEA